MLDPTESIEITADQLAQCRDLGLKGLYLQAYRLAEQWGPLTSWRGTEATVLAGRLAWQLGGSILGNWLIRRASRQDPGHSKAKFYYAYHSAKARGPYATWRWMDEAGDPAADDDAELRAEWFALRAQLTGQFRDFDAAEQWLDRAFVIAPELPWLHVVRATLREQEDRYDDAIQAARRALEIQPWLCPAMQCAAHLLTLQDRDQEALELLAEGADRVESMSVVGQLYALQIELQQYATARETLERCASLAPLADKPFKKWLAAQRSETSYYLGDVPAAIEFAKLAGKGFFETVAARLEDPANADARSVRLDVGFVRQHRMTCGPATLSAISRYWSKPAEHLQVAEEICYNGTSAYNERHWAESNGWFVREFTVTEPSAKSLLDRGIPFTFTTVVPGSAHLQAVIGYDGRRGTLWIRDPYWRNTQECIADKVIEQYRAYGPRGMALVPVEECARLERLELPDASLWDLLRQMDAALIRHDRAAAETHCRQLVAEAGSHRLTFLAQHHFACYDADTADRLEAVNRLREITPDDPCLELDRLSCLRNLACREERIATYARLCEKRDVPPVFLQQYGQELRADARRHTEAVALLLRAIRRAPNDAGSYYILANIYWDQRRFAQALELYRLAACLNDKEESFAESYFIAAQWFKRTEEAIEFLHRRFERFGSKSSFPARTLIQAYLQRNRTAEALTILEESLRRRPDDGELLLFAADTYLSCSQDHTPRAVALLEQAEGRSPRMSWLRTAARVATLEGRTADSLRYWRELLEIQPLAVDAHEAIAQLLAETEGTTAALAHLSQSADRFPHHWPLHQVWLRWISREPDDLHEAVLQRCVESFPHDAWLRREWAIFLHRRQRFDEAREQADIAGQLDPDDPVYHLLKANLLRDEGKLGAARESARQAITLSVDYDPAIRELLSLTQDAAGRREVLRFVKDELVRQVTFGDGLLAFRNSAAGTLDAEELLSALRDALAARPDLWHAWSACVQQLLAMDRRDEAWELSCQATARFPLLPPLWLDRATVCRARNNCAGERESLETAYQIKPDWDSAVCALADFHERQGEFDHSRRLLERAASRQPLNVYYHTRLADSLWRAGQKDQAVERVRRAVEIDPGYKHAWDMLCYWAAELGRRQLAIDVVRNLTIRRAGEARSWWLLAEALARPEDVDERLAALDKATALNPRLLDAHDLRATTLASANRWEEARTACRPAAWGEHPPLELRGRSAWLLAGQGKVTEAIAEMRKVLDEEPGYYWGWSRLWEWSRDAKEFGTCLEAAEALTRISPQYEVSLGYLGEARLLNKDNKGAREAFQRSFDLNPRYSYGGMKLFDLQLEAGDLRAAAGTLARLETHDNNEYVRARAVQLAARQRDPDSAGRTLQEICMAPSDGEWPIQSAVAAMCDAGWANRAQTVLEASLQTDAAQAEAARQWVRLCTSRKQWSCGKRLREMVARGPAGWDAAVAYLDALTKGRQQRRFSRFWRRNKDWLSKNSRTWGMVGYAMANFRWYSKLTLWMADWRDRGDLRAWMLVNVVEGLRAASRDAEANEAGRHALTLPAERSHATHRAWLALDACCRGRIDECRQMLEQLRGQSLEEDYKFLQTLAESVVNMASAEAGNKKAVFRDVRSKLKCAVASYRNLRYESSRRRLYRRCLQLVAQYRGGFLAALWRWDHCFESFFLR
jgi:tetratricopeptide (TPR) repeat protein